MVFHDGGTRELEGTTRNRTFAEGPPDGIGPPTHADASWIWGNPAELSNVHGGPPARRPRATPASRILARSPAARSSVIRAVASCHPAQTMTTAITPAYQARPRPPLGRTPASPTPAG